MWIFGGAKTRTELVKGGRSAERRCETCGAVTTFRECIVKDTLHAFFVDLLDTEQRRMVCSRCGEDHDVEEFFASDRSSVSKAPETPARADRPRSGITKARNAARDDDDLEAELAALKQKLKEKSGGR